MKKILNNIKLNNKLDKKKVTIGLVSTILILILIINGCLNISHSTTNKENKQTNDEIKETSHNLDEIYELISTGAYLRSDDTYSDEWIEFNYVLTHFYDYFNKDTKFMIYNKPINPLGDSKQLENISTIMINYEEYMKITTSDKSIATYDIKVGEEWLNNKKRKGYQGLMIDIAAKEVLGSCEVINKCI